MTEMPFLLIFGITGIILFLSGFLGKILRIPLLLLYILAGILLSQFVHFNEEIKIFGEIGVVILFFFIGLEFNLTRVFEIIKKIWAAGLLDLFFNFGVIFIVLYLMGFDYFVSFAIAGISYASSSAITTKIIIDEHRIANTETEFILGLMVFEDIIAPIIVAFISAFAVGASSDWTISIWIISKILIIIGISIFIAVFVRKILAGFIDKYLKDEVLTLLVIGFVVLASGITKYMGLSEALGAFLVGIIVSESGKSYQVEALIIPIRDITVAYFFLIFGSSVSFVYLRQFDNLWIFVLLLFLSIIGKILTGIIGGKIYGLSKKKSFISGLGIVNRGEFSIAMSQYLSLSISPIISLYIFTLSLVGILFSQYSGFISRIFFRKKKHTGKTTLR